MNQQQVRHISDSKKQYLKELLDQALKDFVICKIDNIRETMDIGSYRNLYQSKNYNLDARFSRSRFQPYFCDKSINNQLLEFMRDELSEYIDKEDRLECGTIDIVGGRTFRLEEFLRDILRIAVIYGAHRAVSVFEKCVCENWIDYKHFVLLSELRLTVKCKYQMA